MDFYKFTEVEIRGACFIRSGSIICFISKFPSITVIQAIGLRKNKKEPILPFCFDSSQKRAVIGLNNCMSKTSAGLT